MVVLVDNYDSFTYNLAQYISQYTDIVIKRNDAFDLKDTIKKAKGVVLSPGPGRPNEAGQMEKMIEKFAPKKHILGICLGHQAIAEVFGAKIVIAKNIKHGKVSKVKQATNSSKIFNNFPKEFEVMRYHSLVIDENSLNPLFNVTSRSTDDNEIMSIEHKTLPIFGLQFHPESIGTPLGIDMIKNFIDLLK